jgi:hypothetical protein
MGAVISESQIADLHWDWLEKRLFRDDDISSVRRRWLRWRRIGSTGLSSYLNWYNLV